MNKIKTVKGITLIALIITIIILLILAVVTIGAIRDSKIIDHAQNAGSSYTIAQEKEQIGLAVSEWQLQKVIPGNTKSFYDVVDAALNNTAEVADNNNGTLTVSFNKTRNVYIVDESGNITKQDVNNKDNDDNDEPVTGDFAITVIQTPNGEPVQSVTLTITPTIPESWKHVYTEEERDLAAKDIANYQGVKNSDGTEITTLEQLLIAAANTMEEVTTPFNKDQYEDVQAMLNTMPGVNITTVDEAFAFAMTAMELNYTTVQEWATDICGYKPTSTVLKIREKGGDWKDVTGNAQWDNLKLSGKYEAPLAETYEIQLILDDKEAFKTEKITYFYLGKYVKYDANGNGSVEDETILWRVLYDDDKVELITADALGEIDLTPENFDDARYKYNNIVDILVEKCKEITGITKNIRSIGAPEVDPIKDDDTIVFEKLIQDGDFNPTASVDIFKKYEGKASEDGIKIESSDGYDSDNYGYRDEMQMRLSGSYFSDNSKQYFVINRTLHSNNTTKDELEWRIGEVLNHNNGHYSTFVFEWFSIKSDGSYRIGGFSDGINRPEGEEPLVGIRPILTLEAGVLDNSTQSGTKDDVIKIYQNK